MATEIITSFQQICDSAGDPISGAKIYVYDVGTTTPRDVYSDDDLDISHVAANPIVCDSAGRHDMRYTATGSYKIVVKTSAGVTVYTRDNIDGRVPVGSGALAIANGGTGATDAAAALTALGGATAAEVADVAADVAALSGALASTEKTHIATGTTGQRPASPIEGDIRRNTTTSLYEFYTGSAWVNVPTYATSSAHPTIQRFTSGTGATYTLPSNAVRLRVRMVGGGGGGGARVTNNGANGTSSSFGSWTAVFGNGGGAATGTVGAGGTGGVDSTGTKIARVDGQAGTGGLNVAGGTAGGGGSSFFGGGAPSHTADAASAAATNSGSGGSGGNNAGVGGAGGGAGEYVEFFITSPSATYTYTVGAGGAGGAAGTTAGGNGAAGIIIVEEYYF